MNNIDSVINAAKHLGLPYIEDVNRSDVNGAVGCARLHFTRDKDQHRHSTYHAFLPADLCHQRKANLHIITNAIVDSLVINGNRCEGANIRSKGVKKTIKSTHEVILSAGPFGSPHLLMLRYNRIVSRCTSTSLIHYRPQWYRARQPSEGTRNPCHQRFARGRRSSGWFPPYSPYCLTEQFFQQDHFAVSVGFEVPMRHSLLCLEKRPWIFIIELIRYLFWGTGLLLALVLQTAIFAVTSHLDDRGRPIKNKPLEKDTLSDIEIMPVRLS